MKDMLADKLKALDRNHDGKIDILDAHALVDEEVRSRDPVWVATTCLAVGFVVGLVASWLAR